MPTKSCLVGQLVVNGKFALLRKCNVSSHNRCSYSNTSHIIGAHPLFKERIKIICTFILVLEYAVDTFLFKISISISYLIASTYSLVSL